MCGCGVKSQQLRPKIRNSSCASLFPCLCYEVMSARELLEHIKSLPPEEQSAFVELFRHWERAGNGAATRPTPKPGTLPDFAGRRRRIFGDGVLSENLVIAARHEERW